VWSNILKDKNENCGFTSISNLDKMFQWELRVFWLIPLGLFFFTVWKTVATIIMVCGFIWGMASDALFSVAVTVRFLRPLFKILKSTRDSSAKSHSRLLLNQTKYMTLVGSTTAVFSSSELLFIFTHF
jgi:hypothetical protein